MFGSKWNNEPLSPIQQKKTVQGKLETSRQSNKRASGA